MSKSINPRELSPKFILRAKKTHYAIIRNIKECSTNIFTNGEIERACNRAFRLTQEMRPYDVKAFLKADEAFDEMFKYFGAGVFYNGAGNPT